MNTNATWRALALVAGIAVLALTAATLPLRRIPAAISELGILGPVVAVVVGALLLAAMVPRTALSVASGALFGALVGAAVAFGAAIIAAIITFVAGRRLGREAVAARMRGRFLQVDEWIARGGVLAVVGVRMLPVTTFGLVGYVYGASAVRWRHYLIGTLIGATPSAFTHPLVGAAVVAPDRLSLLALIPAIVGLVVGTVVLLRWRLAGTR